MIKYCLYAMPLSEENLKRTEGETYKRINGKYILLYSTTDNFLGEYHRIDESEISFLSDSEKLWLLECNMRIIAEQSIEKSDDILKNFSEKLNRLEAELEKESKRIEQ